jgi:hypothetical protein
MAFLSLGESCDIIGVGFWFKLVGLASVKSERCKAYKDLDTKITTSQKVVIIASSRSVTSLVCYCK